MLPHTLMDWLKTAKSGDVYEWFELSPKDGKYYLQRITVR